MNIKDFLDYAESATMIIINIVTIYQFFKKKCLTLINKNKSFVFNKMYPIG